MKCFYSGADAVGLCQACGRGLSLGFATEFPGGLACKNRCESVVSSRVTLDDLDRKLTALSAGLRRQQSSATLVSAVFCILAGGGFLYFTGFGGGISLPTFMGAAFVLYGGYSAVRALRTR